MPNASRSDLLQGALRLPAGDRLALATEILESAEGPEDAIWTAAWATELDRRVSELAAGTAKSIPWEQVKSDTLKRLRSK
jgi:putative addiction module component (TIGR02574 family)